VRLLFASRTPIQRHIKVKGEANPYDPAYETYFKARRSSYGGHVSGYSNASLPLVFTARPLPRMQSADHPDHGMASSSSRPPCEGRFHECR
jgi:hypothetical protein